MKILTPGTDLDAFFDSLGCSSDRLLMLDYDGTLSPYQVERDKAVPYPGVREILADALSSADCRTVIVSGRSISDLLPLLGMERGIEIWGCHGWERLLRDGSYVEPALSDEVREALDGAASWARSEGYGDRLEIKAACVAFHWRGLDERERSRLQSAVNGRWGSLPESLELHGFNGGLELRPAGMHKGKVVELLLSETEGPSAYLGDDKTDEDAFAAISGRGIGVLVAPELRETAADLWLSPPGEMIDFLERWIEKCGGTDE